MPGELILPPDQQPDPNPPPPKPPWWRDGTEVRLILAMLIGFLSNVATIVYMNNRTADKVDVVHERQTENATLAKEAAQDSAAVRSIIVGDK